MRHAEESTSRASPHSYTMHADGGSTQLLASLAQATLADCALLLAGHLLPECTIVCSTQCQAGRMLDTWVEPLGMIL